MLQDLHPGLVVDGRYELERRVGSGGFGEVWRARQLGVERVVAVKFLHPDVGHAAELRFEREARALGALSHRNCVTVHDFGRDAGRVFLATEFVGGETLVFWRTPERTLDEILEVAAQTADGIAHAHAHGILHRDIKPANVLVTDVQGKPHVSVVDFGLARLAAEPQGDITATGRVVGTPGFISPEQLLGDKPDVSSDLYSLGVLLFWLVERRNPFEADTALKVAQRQVLEDAPTLSRDAPPALRKVVAELLDRDPDVRLVHAEGLGETLRRIRANPEAPAERESPVSPSNRMGAMLLGVATIAAVAGVIGVLSQPEMPEDKPPVNLKTVVASAPAVQRDPPAAPREPAHIADPGCTVEPSKHGLVTFTDVKGLTHSSVRVYVPSSYAVGKPHPVVIMLHDALQSPQELLSMTGFAEFADRDGVVLVLPEHDAIRHVWHVTSAQNRVPDLLDLAASKLCLDRKQTFLFGFGAGGTGVSDLRCLMPDVAAVAASGHRRAPGEIECDGIEPTRFLLLSPTAGYSPVNGGPTCLNSKTISLARQEEMIGETNRCGEERTLSSTLGASKCFTWECEREFVSCHISGGRPWPGSAPKNGCEGQPGDYPYRDHVWGFFFSEK